MRAAKRDEPIRECDPARRTARWMALRPNRTRTRPRPEPCSVMTVARSFACGNDDLADQAPADQSGQIAGEIELRSRRQARLRPLRQATGLRQARAGTRRRPAAAAALQRRDAAGRSARPPRSSSRSAPASTLAGVHRPDRDDGMLRAHDLPAKDADRCADRQARRHRASQAGWRRAASRRRHDRRVCARPRAAPRRRDRQARAPVRRR